MSYRALKPIEDEVCGRLSRRRSNWINLDPDERGYADAMVDALEWAIPKGRNLYELFLHNPSIWRLPHADDATDCHEVLREAVAAALEEPVWEWMLKNQSKLANVRLLKPRQ